MNCQSKFLFICAHLRPSVAICSLLCVSAPRRLFPLGSDKNSRRVVWRADTLPRGGCGEPMSPNRKIRSLEELLEYRRLAGLDGRTVVHCHGCFDIVHPGHIHYLQFARSLGDVLVVTVSADVQVDKG